MHIQGYRSFSNDGMTIQFNDKLVGFIGLNSSGKTSALEAFKKLFGTSKAERGLVREDFHIPMDGEDVGRRDLSIEAIIQFEDEEGSVPHFFSHMVVDETDANPYIRVRLEASWSKSNIYPDGLIEDDLYFVRVSKGVEEQPENKLPFPGHLRGLIQVLYVPAIRRPAEQIKYASGSILYRILRRIKWDDTFKDDFQTHVDDISKLFKAQSDVDGIEKTIKKFWNKFHKDNRYKQADLNFGGNDFESILKKLEISFSPSGTSRPYRVDDLGEGYRSLFYLTLVCSMLDLEEKLVNNDDDSEASRPLLTILAIEEPENHIAPQLLGRVINILKTIAKKNNTQVVLSSHTASIVKRLKPESICHFQIGQSYTTTVNTLLFPTKQDEAYKYIKEAVQNYPEIYFAKLVVIGEGDSEDVLFNKLMQTNSVDFDDNIITFAPLGHRFVNHIWKLLDQLSIPHVTLLDLDVERDGGGYGRVKYIIGELIKIGVSDKKLLATANDGTIDLETMGTWTVNSPSDLRTLLDWAESLEEHNVFYSAPLDLDFLMLSHYPDIYKQLIPQNGGPRIPDKVKEATKFAAKVTEGIQATLKSDKATAKAYTDAEKELMIWYNYHFLNRGKPVTHIQALSNMTVKQLDDGMPPVFKRVFKGIGKSLENN